jgi:hypothetical protein
LPGIDGIPPRRREDRRAELYVPERLRPGRDLAILLCYVFRLVNNFVAFLGWFYSLIFGRMHEGMRNLSAWLFRYELQTYAYIFLLTARYPSLEGSPKV